MASAQKRLRHRVLLGAALSLTGAALVGVPCFTAWAQAPAPAPAAGPKVGTVKAIEGATLTVATDAGQTVKIVVLDGARVQQLAVGSTDLKTATPSQLSDVAVGDRVLAAVKPGDAPDSFTSTRVVLMKSGDIAEKNAAEQADWRKNGTGGIVSAIDPSGALTVTAGTKKIVVNTSSKTTFRRFAGDSVKFQDAKPGTFAQLHVGDQIQARGAKSEDGSSVQAVEVVSGSFQNLSGLISSIDAAAGRITLKDLATKKTITVNVTSNADIRAMPAEMAARFAARSAGGAGGGRGGPSAGAAAAGSSPAGAAKGAGGGDLAQMISRMPTGTLAELKPNDAVMIVASEPAPGATTVTAITLLSGVEPILTANPNGGMNLSGWSMGGGGGAAE